MDVRAVPPQFNWFFRINIKKIYQLNWFLFLSVNLENGWEAVLCIVQI